MALTTLQKDAILSHLPSVFANEEGRIKLAEYIIAGEISWEEIEEMGSLSASQIEELRLTCKITLNYKTLDTPMKSINIFITGTKESATQRIQLHALISELNLKFEEAQKGIHLNVSSHETFIGSGQECNAFVVDEADLVILVLKDRIDSRTEDEYLLALSKKRKTGRPDIVVFLQQQDELTSNMAYINSLLKHEECHSYIDDEDFLFKAEDFLETSAFTQFYRPCPSPPPSSQSYIGSLSSKRESFWKHFLRPKNITHQVASLSSSAKEDICCVTHEDGGTTYIPKPRPRATTLHSIDVENNTTRVSNMMPQASYSRPIGISMLTLWKNIFQKKQKSSPADYSEVFSSIYAPAEVKRGAHLLAQVYLHLYDETEQVKAHAQMADKNAEQRGYIPLSLNLKKGDNVDIEFHVDGETRLMSERKSITWRGSFTKCTFKYHVPKDIDIEELSCEANLFVNGALIGEMTFLTQIVESPRKLNTEILSHRFKKIFISYAHEDYSKVKFMAQAYKAQGVDYFLDRDYLKAGDIYPRKISDYINSADLFILCWSQNAAESDYVGLEISQALSIAKNTDPINGTLTIHPISITPRAKLPDDMKDHYNFDKI